MFSTISPISFTAKQFSLKTIKTNLRPALSFQGDVFTPNNETPKEAMQVKILLRRITAYTYKLNNFRQLALAYSSKPAKEVLSIFDKEINLKTLYKDIETIANILQTTDKDSSKQVSASLKSIDNMKKNYNTPVSINRELSNDINYNLKTLLRELKEIYTSIKSIQKPETQTSENLQKVLSICEKHMNPVKVQAIIDFTQQRYDKYLEL